MEFSIMSRLRAVASTQSGRRHLAKTWKFSLQQAGRAMSGAQISEVLTELNSLESSMEIESNHHDHKPLLIGKEAFVALAGQFSAGKRKGHEEVYPLLELDSVLAKNILEVGIGTNDPKAASSMGKAGVPGSSLQMWEVLFPHAQIVGADVDKSSFFFSDRVVSKFVDQMDSASLGELYKLCSESGEFDLVVDDGLHTPEANLRTFNSLSGLLRIGGYYVLEDIDEAWQSLWGLLGRAMPNYETFVVKSDFTSGRTHGFFVARRIK
jgi:hypothetical protein